jgi:hypothetical protein
MIARLAPYRVPPDAVAPLIEEIVAVARARSRGPARRTNRRARGRQESGVVGRLFGRVVRCDPGSVGDLSFDGDAVPSSPDVWARALLVAPNGGVVAFAVATERAALEHSLCEFSAR